METQNRIRERGQIHVPMLPAGGNELQIYTIKFKNRIGLRPNSIIYLFFKIN